MDISTSKLEAATTEKVALLEEKEQEIARLKHRIRLLERALFGPRSERVVDDGSGDQLEFGDLLSELLAAGTELEDVEKEKNPAKKSNRAESRRRTFDELTKDANLETQEILLDLDEEDKISLETGKPLVCIGEERTFKLVYIPGSYKKKVFIRPKYIDPADSLRGVITAPLPTSAFPGSHFDESFAANVVVEKCAYHIPLYRQEEKHRASGLQMHRQTLSKLYGRSAQVLLPLYLLMKELILQGDILFTDDTPVKMQKKGHGKTVTGRMWVYVGGGNSPPFRIFDFTPNRNAEHPKKFLLEGDIKFNGYIHADAYKGYDDLFTREGIYECGCWMHVRRKLFEAEDGPPKLRRTLLAGIRLLYRYERQLRKEEASLAEILKLRQGKTAPLIDKLFEYARKARLSCEVLPSSQMAKAIDYMLNLGDALKTFTTQPQLKPDNGTSERALRPLAIGRKNWMFVGSEKGGAATAILTTVVQSCRDYNLPPLTYIEDVLRKIPAAKEDPEQLRALLPDKWVAPVK